MSNGGGMLEALGQGLQGAGAVLSSEVYETQAAERQNALTNVLRNLQITKEMRSMKADERVRAAMKGLHPGMTSSAMLEVFDKLDPADAVDSSIGPQWMQAIHQRHQQEVQTENQRRLLQNHLDTINKPTDHFDPTSGKLIRSYRDGRTEVVQVEPGRDVPRTRMRISGSTEIQEEFDPGTKTWKEIGKGPRFASTAVGGAIGGAGSLMMQDRDTGKRYMVNQRAGKAWELDDEGEWKAINVNNLPKNLLKVGNIGTAGAREAVFTQRLIQAGNQSSKDLENVVALPMTSSRGVFGAMGPVTGPSLMDAGKVALANKVTPQEAQTYMAIATGFQRTLAAIESAGLMPSGQLTHQMDAVIWKPGDTNLTKLHKIAQTRQIIESGMEVVLDNPRISESEKDRVRTIRDRVVKAVPFTHLDLIRLEIDHSVNPKTTLREVLAKKKKEEGGSAEPQKSETPTFASEKEAETAAAKKEIKTGDKIIVNGKSAVWRD